MKWLIAWTKAPVWVRFLTLYALIFWGLWSDFLYSYTTVREGMSVQGAAVTALFAAAFVIFLIDRNR